MSKLTPKFKLFYFQDYLWRRNPQQYADLLVLTLKRLWDIRLKSEAKPRFIVYHNDVLTALRMTDLPPNKQFAKKIRSLHDDMWCSPTEYVDAYVVYEMYDDEDDVETSVEVGEVEVISKSEFLSAWSFVVERRREKSASRPSGKKAGRVKKATVS
jgi:hypothetical protein